MLYIWIVFIILYSFASLKIQIWQTIARLGFPTEAPLLFIKHSDVYHYLSISLFLVCLITPIISEQINVGLIIIPVFLSFILGIHSRNQGLKKYRKVLKEMLNEENDESYKEKYLKQLNKTDQELFEEIKIKKQ